MRGSVMLPVRQMNVQVSQNLIFLSYPKDG
jgi:hypothetical protein